MAIPRVFISSTYYDLKYIRENLRYFIRTIGYEPTLSEDGNVFYNPKKHTHDSCISEVPACQMFVLIIGGRFGGTFRGSDRSITNEEYSEAVRQKVPVFALVEQAVYQEHHVYNENIKNNPATIHEKIKYPSVDNPKIFDFIDDVRKNSVNNAVVPFRDFADIEEYLKKQWAGMMFNFLHDEIEADRVADTLEALTTISKKVEILSEQILRSVGTDKAKVAVKLYETFLGYGAFRDLSFVGIKVKADDILKYKDLISLGKAYDREIRAYTEDENMDGERDWTLSASGSMGAPRLEGMKKEYLEMRKKALALLSKNGWTEESFLKAAD